MRKIIAFALVLTLALSLAACGGYADGNSTTPPSSSTPSQLQPASSTPPHSGGDIVSPQVTSDASVNAIGSLSRRGTAILGYIDLPKIISTSKSYADELPPENLRISQSLIAFRNFLFHDYIQSDLVPPDDRLTVIIRRELRDIDLYWTIEEYTRPNSRFFNSRSEEDCVVAGYSGKLIKCEDCLEDMHIYFAGDNWYSYVFINDDVSAPFVIEFIWNPKTSAYNITDFISTYRFDS